MFDTGGEYGNGSQRESAKAEVQQQFSILLLSHKYGSLNGKMTGADVSDNQAAQTKFPVVHCEVWLMFSSRFQRFQFDPNSPSQSVARPHVRGERLCNNIWNQCCRLAETVLKESRQKVKSSCRLWIGSKHTLIQTFVPSCFQWFHSQDSGVTPNSSPSPTRRVRYRNLFFF